MLQAGDLIPEITPAKVMVSPGDAPWIQEHLIGQVTVFVFFANVYDATEALARRWNESVDRFAGKVQFVMIARDDKSKLKPWLERNPLKGWLLLDSNSELARAFGMPHTVFVDQNGRILGFGQEPLPFDSQIEDVLAGRVARPRLRVKPIPPGGDKPDVPPSYTVHIAPTKREQEEGTSQSSGFDHWTALGFELKAVLAEVYGMEVSRLEFLGGFDAEARYDFRVLLPEEEGRETIDNLVQQAIERHFNVTIKREIRSRDAYILTAPNGLGPSLQAARFQGGGSMGMSSSPIPWHSPDGTPPSREDLRRARVSISNISGSGMTIARLCSAIENQLDRPVIDETGLLGEYDFGVQSAGNRDAEFFRALQDQLGLVVTRQNRDVTMLVVRRA